MNGAGQACIVDKAHHRLAAFFNHERGARGDSIISNKNRLALGRVHLLGELVDVDLVVVNKTTGDGVCDRSVTRQYRLLEESCSRSCFEISQSWCLERRNWERELVKPGIRRAFPVFSGNEFGARTRNGRPEGKPEGTEGEKDIFERTHRETFSYRSQATGFCEPRWECRNIGGFVVLYPKTQTSHCVFSTPRC